MAGGNQGYGGRVVAKPPVDDDAQELITDIDVTEEMETSFLEYAYSVIYARAIPDARDGLKPVQRRILYSMDEMGVKPDRPHVKCARVVGDVMGKLHPHGDTAIYDALVRLGQDFAMRLPVVDGHGNFGSLDSGPAAMRYTECRMAPAALAMTDELDQETVDFRPNYDGKMNEPVVLPAAFPNLLVNGSTGIAVGMATNIPPHNLVECIQAVKHLLKHPDADVAELMRFVPGPDLPTGGKIVGLDGIGDAYRTGRGSFKIRATARIEQTSPRRKGIVVTELPYMVGPEKIMDQIKTLVQNKKLSGIADIKDLTDLANGTRLVIEVKNGINPDAMLEQLYKMTKLEDSFGINMVALVEGQPQTLSLRDALVVYADHRMSVTLRRTRFQHRKASERLHLVEGLLIAIADIDDVIAIIRGSDDVASARAKLIEVFELSEAQANYILDLQLRRLTKFSRIELESERDDLRDRIDALLAIIDDDAQLRALVAKELDAVARTYGTPRRTVLLAGGGAPVTTAAPLEIADDPCVVMLSSAGLLARADTDEPIPADGRRAQHDVIVSAVRTTARGEYGVLTSAGRVLRAHAIELPSVALTADAPNLKGGSRAAELLDLGKGERILALTTLTEATTGWALGTARGVVKRVVPELLGRDSWEVIRLEPGDEVVGALELRDETDELVFVSSDAQLLHFPAAAVRPQGRSGGGVAGIKLAPGTRAVFFGATPEADAVVVTVSGSSDALPGTEVGLVKVTGFEEYPGKGRATGGVRCHRFLKGEDALTLAWVGPAPAIAAAASGSPVDLPPATGRRDGSGTPLPQPVVAISTRSHG
ncbi:DNA topoisomerase IV subunit A [Propioniciclava coleopterorum]|uniref:DNA topoisomerase (ATP-hydrolyzing) n=1 Tax=Propioniciclava coleopterorum TaxID=2714937 RepID=A0A6G7Y9C7_9ACTN|nr:DNA topoisomerase IV subunit A [Propioniciclava coleopterorum]QIK73422.1 DNA topoisomerase IV subunit A [Propioniciclava coleopterorum]